MTDYAPTALSTVRRGAGRGTYDRAVVEAILDEGFVCHVSLALAGQPVCIPMAYARVRDAIYLHGSTANRVLRALRDGARACVTVTLLDGLVLGRSAFRHSVNYRSVVIYGAAREVTEDASKRSALEAIVNGVVPERWPDVRGPSATELRQTLVLELPLVEVSAKVRSGPPIDLEEDYALACWAGVVPLRLVTDAPIEDPRLPPGVPTPRYATDYARPGAGDTARGEGR